MRTAFSPTPHPIKHPPNPDHPQNSADRPLPRPPSLLSIKTRHLTMCLRFLPLSPPGTSFHQKGGAVRLDISVSVLILQSGGEEQGNYPSVVSLQLHVHLPNSASNMMFLSRGRRPSAGYPLMMPTSLQQIRSRMLDHPGCNLPLADASAVATTAGRASPFNISDALMP